MGPLGIPAAITAAIRVSGSGFLKGLIGRGRESQASIEKELMSSTSNEVCELCDGKRVVRLEAAKPLIQQLIYADDKWYNLKEAASSKKIFLSLNMKNRELGGADKGPGPRCLEEGGEGADEGPAPGRLEEDDAVPPNLSLNLIPEHWRWKLPAAVILGISLQLLVLIIARLTTFYPHWKDRFSIRLYAFYCVVGGTLLLTFGLITCVLAVDQGTIEETYKTKSGKKVDVLWLQRGLSEDDESYKPYVLRVKRGRIQTSRRRPSGDPDKLWEALTLAGTVATTLGYIIQFIGLGGMHWPTQAAQFVVTLIMTGVRALIRQAPPISKLEATPDNHEMDWLATDFPETSSKDKGYAEVWQMITGGSLGIFEDPSLFTITEIATLWEGVGQTLLSRRKDLGVLCKWTGPARKWAISLATAIDEVMNIIHAKIPLKSPFLWPLNVRAHKKEQRIWFTIKCSDNRWKSDFTEIEAALSLALFGISPKPTQDEEPRNSDEPDWPSLHEEKARREISIILLGPSTPPSALSLGNSGLSPKITQDKDPRKSDWLRLHEEKAQRKISIVLLGSSTPAALRDLRWWLGSQNGKLKEVSLHKNEDGIISKIEQRRPDGFASLLSEDKGVSEIGKHRIAGFESSWQNVGKPDSGRQNSDSSANKPWCLAAVSEVDMELLYARHMFSAFMWTIAKVAKIKIAKEFHGETSRFDPKNEESWQSLKLHNSTVLELANCVERAGLGDMEDAYLSIIPPLSTTELLGSEEVLETARRIALEEQCQGKWESAYNVYRLLFRNFKMFGVRDKMAIKATALFTEFFRLLSRTTKLHEIHIVKGNVDEASTLNRLKKLKGRVLDDLKKADRGVMNSLVDLYTVQGWSEDCNELQLKHQGNDFKLVDLPDALNQTPLHVAAMKGDEGALNKLLENAEKAKLMERDLFGRTALHYATCKRSKQNEKTSKRSDGAIRLLLESLRDEPGSKDTTDDYGMTALHIAAEIGHVRVVEKLIDVRADTAIKTPGGRTALHLAVLGCRGNVVSKLLEKKGSDAVDGSGRTALHLAALSKDVEELLQQEENSETKDRKKGEEGGEEGGKEGNEKVAGWVSELVKKFNEKKDIDGRTALHLAAQNGHKVVVGVLLEKEAAVNATNDRGWTALHLAAQRGHEAVVGVLLQNGAEVNATNDDGWTALHWAAQNGHEAVVGALLQNGAKVNTTDDDGWTALYWAAQNGHEAVVGALLQNGAEVNMKSKDGWTALHLAGRNGHEAVVGALLQNRAEVNATDDKGWTALHWAGRNGYEVVVDALLKRDAKVNMKSKDGWTALRLAAENGHEAVVGALLQNGAEVNATSTNRGTPLHWAAAKGHNAAVGVLLENGAAVNATDDRGWTPLHLAAENGHEAVVGALLQNGAEVNATNDKGWTALYWGAQNGHEAVVGALLQNGAEVNMKSKDGWTALRLAAENGHEAVVGALLKNGAEVNATSTNRGTPLHWAAAKGHNAAVGVLLENGAAVKATDDRGWTPLHLAGRNGHEVVVGTLLQNGAEVNATDDKGWTALHWAAAKGHNAVVDVLLENGAAVNAMDNNGWTPLHLATENRHEAVLGVLLKNRATVNATSTEASENAE